MECIICYENIKDSDKVALSCRHIFHTECIIELIRKRYRKCPLCRTRITWNVPQFQKHIKLSKKI